MKPHELTKVFSGSTALSTWVTGFLTLYCGGAFVISLARHLDGMSIGLTGIGLMMFAAMTAWNLRSLREERRAEAEYNQSLYRFTASRHSSKPVRSP